MESNVVTTDTKNMNDPKEILTRILAMSSLQPPTVDTNSDPYAKGATKALNELGYAHAVEAVQQGVPPEHIISELVNKQTQQALQMQSQHKKGIIGTLLEPIFGTPSSADEQGKLIQNAQNAQKTVNMGSQQNMDQAIQNMKQINSQLETELPGYEVAQTAEGGFQIKPKPASQDEMLLGLKEDQRQDRLEQNYRTLWTKGLSRYSGGLGLQDSKVNQAIDLRTMINQYYDPKTGTYSIPPSLHTELAIGLARLLSPTSQTAERIINKLQQRTGREALSELAIYMGADPKKVGGSTQSVIKMFVDSIDRQGLTSEKLRNKYYDQLRKMSPKELKKERKEAVDSEMLGSSYTDFLKDSPDYKDSGKTNDLSSMSDEELRRIAGMK